MKYKSIAVKNKRNNNYIREYFIIHVDEEKGKVITYDITNPHGWQFILFDKSTLIEWLKPKKYYEESYKYGSRQVYHTLKNNRKGTINKFLCNAIWSFDMYGINGPADGKEYITPILKKLFKNKIGIERFDLYKNKIKKEYIVVEKN